MNKYAILILGLLLVGCQEVTLIVCDDNQVAEKVSVPKMKVRFNGKEWVETK